MSLRLSILTIGFTKKGIAFLHGDPKFQIFVRGIWKYMQVGFQFVNLDRHITFDKVMTESGDMGLNRQIERAPSDARQKELDLTFVPKRSSK
jgi:hypothetical protein